MEIITEIEAFAKMVAAFGLPFWAGMVLWGFYQVRKLLSGAIEALRSKDASLQEMLNQHISSTNLRLALLEQLLGRHDESLESLWERLNQSNKRFIP